MPEMPEVEIIRRGLDDKIKNKQIKDLEVFLPRLIKWPAPPTFGAMVIGKTISGISRKGKYLLLELGEDTIVVIHLRMTGRLCYTSSETPRDSYTRIVFHLDNGDYLIYADTRTLGTLYALQRDELWRVSGLEKMGPEPLSESFTIAYLQDMLMKNKGKIKPFLLNQKYIGGLGNIYVDESLLLAGIHPERAGNSLGDGEIEVLFAAINRVIGDGIKDGGTTFRDYRDSSGGKGSHQQHLLVYGRDGLPCVRCGTLIEKTQVGGRGTHFCPTCQR